MAEDVEIKVSVQDLLNKKDFKNTKIEFKNVQINLYLENLKKYKIFSKKKFNSQPIILRKSKINFLPLGFADFSLLKILPTYGYQKNLAL